MKILLTDAGKRFNRDWIFRHLTYEFSEGQTYAIIGPNGSGKSTLLQALSGSLLLNEGSSSWYTGDKKIDPENIFRSISFSAPYLELVEEMTAVEFLGFHSRFKSFISALGIHQILEIIGLKQAAHKQIRYFSSGMKQRIKLAQAVFSDVPVILLDEPCTNLDEAGIDLYRHLIREYCQKRMVIVSSNDHHEYEFCSNRINITDWK